MASKLSLRATDTGLARTLVGALENFIEPPLDAVTQFADGADAWLIEAYCSAPCDAAAIGAQLENALGVGVPPIEVIEVPDLNWVTISQDALPPVAAGRFLIHGSHDAGRIARGPNSILIDAGEAFGTAHHATTQGCLMMIDSLARSKSFRRVLDLGCGSGVLAIAAARALPRASIMASDSDPKAVAVATANAVANGVGQRIAFVCAEGLEHAGLQHAAPFDLVAANILAGPLCHLAPHVRMALADGGSLVLGGLLDPEASQVIATYLAHGFVLVERRSIAGWTTLLLRKRPQFHAPRVAEASWNGIRRSRLRIARSRQDA
jgi:ribosomal protein L11 methyltransferase